jgi:hypothetical protein
MANPAPTALAVPSSTARQDLLASAVAQPADEHKRQRREQRAARLTERRQRARRRRRAAEDRALSEAIETGRPPRRP